MGARGPKPKYLDVSCPNENCPLYALTDRGNVVSRGTRETKSGDIVRIFRCNRCGCNFNSRTGTAYAGLHCSQDDFDSAYNQLVDGSGVRETSRSKNHTPETIIRWSRKAAAQCRGTSAALEDDLRPSNLQFDELTAMVHGHYVPMETDSDYRLHGPWVWTAIEPYNKYWFGALYGDRTYETGHGFLNDVWDKMVDGHVPTMTSDGYRVYARAIKERFVEKDMVLNPVTGRMNTIEIVPKRLRYGQVIKELKNGKMEVVERREVYGHVPPQDFNTSFIERLNTSIRTFMSRMYRKSLKYSKLGEMLQNAFDMCRAHYNLVRPHSGLYVKGKHNGGVPVSVTPAMKQGVTDHVWSTRELMSFLFRQNMHYKS